MLPRQAPQRGYVKRRRARRASVPYTDYWREQAMLRESRPGIGGAAKRRKRKGGNPAGGPGQRGAGMRPSTPRSRRGFLVSTLKEPQP